MVISKTAGNANMNAPIPLVSPATKDVAIVVPVYNQIAYTRQCIEGLLSSEARQAELIVVDNGSTDGTAEYLRQLAGVRNIRNTQNRGVACAWNQGVNACTTAWVVILNNDTVLPIGWLHGLLTAAAEYDYDVISPSLREGQLDYPVESYAERFVTAMGEVFRPGVADGACFAVHRRVFDHIGGFDERFRYAQFEDVDFFLRAGQACFQLGITGRSFIHHYSSVTQRALQDSGLAGDYEVVNRAYFRQKWDLRQPKRFWLRWKRKGMEWYWARRERYRYGYTLKEST